VETVGRREKEEEGAKRPSAEKEQEDKFPVTKIKKIRLKWTEVEGGQKPDPRGGEGKKKGREANCFQGSLIGPRKTCDAGNGGGNIRARKKQQEEIMSDNYL